MSPRPRPPRALLAVATLGALCAAGCGRDPTLTVELTADQIEQALARKLPATRAAHGATVTVETARILLSEGSDRIGVRAAVVVAGPLGLRLAGTVQLAGQIRYAPDVGELWFDEPGVVDLEVARLPASLKPGVDAVLTTIAQTWLARTPIVRLNPADLKQSVARTLLRSAIVRNGRLVLVLGPKP